MGYTVDEDYKLIHRIRKGDEEAAEKFISKYYKDIYCYCYRRIEDKVASEDLTQDVFMKFYTYLDRYVHKGKAKHYLYVIAGNLCKNYYKKETLLKRGFRENESYEDKYYLIDDQLSLETALAKLPKEQREVILLHYFRGLKLKEVSKVRGITLSLVKYRLGRGVEKLSKILKSEDWIG